MDLTLWKGKLDAYLDPQEGDMLRLLERIVNMDSFTTDAQDVDQLGTVLTDWLREAGFQTFMMPKTEAPADEPWQGGSLATSSWPRRTGAKRSRGSCSSGIWIRFSPRVRRRRGPSR